MADHFDEQAARFYEEHYDSLNGAATIAFLAAELRATHERARAAVLEEVAALDVVALGRAALTDVSTAEAVRHHILAALGAPPPREHPIWETLRNAPRRKATPAEEASLAAMRADPEASEVVDLAAPSASPRSGRGGWRGRCAGTATRRTTPAGPLVVRAWTWTVGPPLGRL
jgi:hypothetical protein